MSGKAARGLGKSRQSFHFLERPKKASAAQLILTFVFGSFLSVVCLLAFQITTTKEEERSRLLDPQSDIKIGCRLFCKVPNNSSFFCDEQICL